MTKAEALRYLNELADRVSGQDFHNLQNVMTWLRRLTPPQPDGRMADMDEHGMAAWSARAGRWTRLERAR
jgi:hypothetical protein